jgi:SAM-dependent methyltransferase
VNWLQRRLDPEVRRDQWVASQLEALAPGKILDAGAGSQRYRRHCGHLQYFAQDLGEHSRDAKDSFAASGQDAIYGAGQGYAYGPLDYKGDIWDIPAPPASFDYLLCTEVFEHIPYPIETVREFARLLKPGGLLLLTLPAASLRHFDPYYFYSGFSDRWVERILPQEGFDVELCEPQGDYYSWLAVELARLCQRHKAWSPLLLPAFLFAYAKGRRPTPASRSTQCQGYHVRARRRA